MTDNLENWKTKINENYGLTFTLVRISKNIKRYYNYVRLIIDEVNKNQTLKTRFLSEIDNIFEIIINCNIESEEDESKETNYVQESKEVDPKMEIIILLGDFYLKNNKKFNISFLWQAIEKNDINIVKYLLPKVISDINMKNVRGDTAIMQAVKLKNYEIVKLLHENGADVNIQNNNGSIPLMIAIYEGNKNISDFLLDKSDINIIDKKRNNIIAYAIKSKLETPTIIISIIKTCIDKGININTPNINGYTPLMLASVVGNTDIVKFLLANGADKNLKNRINKTAFDLAVNAEVANLLSINGRRKLILNPIENNILNREKFDILLNHSNINIQFDNKNTILHNIIHLLNETIQLETTSTTLIESAIDSILEKNINVDQQNEDGDTALMLLVKPIPFDSNLYKSNRLSGSQLTVESFKSRMVTKILAKTKNINIKNKKNETALKISTPHHYECSRQAQTDTNNLDIIESLLNFKDIKYDKDDLQNGFISAIKQGHVQKLDLFKKYKDELNVNYI
jgi:ankyrin repeat protein